MLSHSSQRPQHLEVKLLMVDHRILAAAVVFRLALTISLFLLSSHLVQCGYKYITMLMSAIRDL